MRRRMLRVPLGLVALPLLAAVAAFACGGDDVGPLDLRGEFVGTDDPAITGSVMMSPKPSVETSGPTGRIRQGCGRDADILNGFCTVEIEVSGLPEGAHATQILEGTCDSPGPVDRTLDEIVAAASGSATVTAQFPHLESKAKFNSGHLISIHESGPDSPIIACAEMALRPDPAAPSN
jgi:hypothetical protein